MYSMCNNNKQRSRKQHQHSAHKQNFTQIQNYYWKAKWIGALSGWPGEECHWEATPNHITHTYTSKSQRGTETEGEQQRAGEAWKSSLFGNQFYSAEQKLWWANKKPTRHGAICNTSAVADTKKGVKVVGDQINITRAYCEQ